MPKQELAKVEPPSVIVGLEKLGFKPKCSCPSTGDCYCEHLTREGEPEGVVLFAESSEPPYGNIQMFVYYKSGNPRNSNPEILPCCSMVEDKLRLPLKRRCERIGLRRLKKILR